MWDENKKNELRKKLFEQLTEYSLFVNSDFLIENAKYSIKRVAPLGDCMQTEDILELSSSTAAIVHNVIQSEITDLRIMLAIIDAGENAPMTEVIDILGREHCKFNCSDYLHCHDDDTMFGVDYEPDCNSCGSNGSCTSCANRDNCRYRFNYELNRYVLKADYNVAADICVNYYHRAAQLNCTGCMHYKKCDFYKYGGEYIHKDVYVMERYKERWKTLIETVNKACSSDEQELEDMDLGL